MDMTKLAVLEEGNIVAGADMNIFSSFCKATERLQRRSCKSSWIQALAFQHIEEINISAEIQLVGLLSLTPSTNNLVRMR
jgi:hypothetical protein